MAQIDKPTRELVGHVIWHTLAWIEAYTEPGGNYEIHDQATQSAYRVTIERIPYGGEPDA